MVACGGRAGLHRRSTIEAVQVEAQVRWRGAALGLPHFASIAADPQASQRFHLLCQLSPSVSYLTWPLDNGGISTVGDAPLDGWLAKYISSPPSIHVSSSSFLSFASIPRRLHHHLFSSFFSSPS